MNESEFFLVIRAEKEHLDVLLPIYEEFLGYYHKRYGSLLRDIGLERRKILEHLESQFDVDKSVVLMATIRSSPTTAAGFVLISPVVQLDGNSRKWSIKDMFVSSGHRRKGLALTLLREACDYCRSVNAQSISLLTGKINIEAQKLYEKYGFIKDRTYKDRQNVKYKLKFS